MGYQVGDKVIHWNYGLGEIIQLDVKSIHGLETRCFVVRIRDLTIWVTAGETGASSLRLPTPAGDFETLFAILHSPGEPLPNDRFERKSQLFERLRDGKLTSICTVIRDLSSHRLVKKFNYDDKIIFERAEDLLLTEWMFSLSVPKSQAHLQLGQLLTA